MNATARPTSVGGFEAVVLENPRVRAVIVPPLGGRVWELWDRRRERQWIWHRDDVALAAPASWAVYDDVWAGGWEELFPNDAPADIEGRTLPDHGEWWAADWAVAKLSDGAEGVVRLVSDSRILRVTCAKEFRLAADADTLVVSYRIESREREPFHFLFKQHLAVALTASCEIALPGGRVTAVQPRFGTLLPGPGPFDWPFAEGRSSRVDLRRVPPRGDAREFVYVSGLPDGWCGVNDVAQGASLRLRFDLRELPFTWLFLSYGGWRGCYTAVLEPCTNMPKDLEEAARSGRSARLDPGAVFQARVAVALGGLTGASRSSPASSHGR